MRKILVSLFALGLLSTTALAADMPVKAAAQPNYVQPAVNWTGPWLGLLIGYASKDEDTTITGNDKNSQKFISSGFFPGTIPLRPDGLTIGGRLGYDYQFAPRFVVGAIVDWSYSNMKGDAYAGGNLIGINYSEKITNIGDVLGRVGYLVTDRALVYVAGGGTWATVKNTVSSNGLLPAGGLVVSGNSSDTRWGWSIGGGVEYRMDKSWSMDVQYLYSKLGNQGTQVVLPVGKNTFSWTNDQAVEFQRLMVGINYRL